jgi:ABC-type polar amino acid transport system ATPase subunit
LHSTWLCCTKVSIFFNKVTNRVAFEEQGILKISTHQNAMHHPTSNTNKKYFFIIPINTLWVLQEKNDKKG